MVAYLLLSWFQKDTLPSIYTPLECSSFRLIARDEREYLKDQMRKRFEQKENQEIYKKRSYTAERPQAQIKHNLKFKMFMRRGKEKVAMETALLLMLANIMKLGAVFSGGGG